MLSREANTTCSFFRKFVKFVSYKYKEFNIIIIIQLLELTSIEFITFFFKGKVTLIVIASASVYMIYKDPKTLNLEKGYNSCIHMDAFKFVVLGFRDHMSYA